MHEPVKPRLRDGSISDYVLAGVLLQDAQDIRNQDLFGWALGEDQKSFTVNVAVHVREEIPEFALLLYFANHLTPSSAAGGLACPYLRQNAG
jgi:hypothetical protein